MFPSQRRRNKSEEHYQLVRQALLDNHINTADAAETKIQQIINGARRYSLVAAIIALAVAGIFPQQAPLCGLLLICALVWIWSSSLAGKRYIKRYIDEELNQPKNTADTEQTDTDQNDKQ